MRTEKICRIPMRSRCVTYRILERADGRFDLEVTSVTGFTVQREGFTSLTEADAALRDLRAALSISRWHLLPQGGPALA